MRFITVIAFVLAVAGSLCAADTQAPCRVSDRPVAEFKAHDTMLPIAWLRFRQSQGLLMGYEQIYQPGDGSSAVPPRYNLEFKATTTKAVLDELVRLEGSTHTWSENGQWINVVPRGRENDPDYWMNRRLQATVTVTAERVRSEPQSAWSSVWENVSTLVNASGLVSVTRAQAIQDAMEGKPGVALPPPDPPFRAGEIVLQNPTVREVTNARVYMMGYGGYWVTTRESTGTDGKPRASATFAYYK